MTGYLSKPPPRNSRPLAKDVPPPRWFTIGHSTRPMDEFAGLLQAAGADMVVDVRSMPRSRTNPQFNTDVMAEALAPWQIGYRHIPALGGLRGRQRALEGPSPNEGWRNKSFRNYADYALTPAFAEGMAELETLGQERRCALMCAEAVWWRCHRRIIADYLLARGEPVLHILAADNIRPATMTPGAQVTDRGVVYPG